MLTLDPLRLLDEIRAVQHHTGTMATLRRRLASAMARTTSLSPMPRYQAFPRPWGST
jgi:hypothetical protein